jgi:hypothetical protein
MVSFVIRYAPQLILVGSVFLGLTGCASGLL